MKETPRIGFQLYSARALPADEAILSMLAGAGYRHVETYGPWHDDPHRTRSLADRHGLSVPTAHIALAMIKDEFQRVIDIATTLGAKLVVAPYLGEDERPQSGHGWRELARELESHAKRLQAQDLRLAWHNHDFEFAKLPDGSLPMDVLLDDAPNLLWEVDVGWTVLAGQDPLAWFARHGPRISALHIKDIAKPGSQQVGDGWCSVGTGAIDWIPILAAARNNAVAEYIIEHDNPPDAAAFAVASYSNLQKLMTQP